MVLIQVLVATIIISLIAFAGVFALILKKELLNKAIAASFVINLPLGISTTLAVALHEIPQELGDFAVLVYGGFGNKKALLFNFITALTAILGGIIGYLTSSVMQTSMIYLLPFAAGNFIYIAAADLIPEIKHQVGIRRSILHFIVFLIGIAIMLLVKFIH